MEDSGFDSDPKIMQNDIEQKISQSDSMDSSASPENSGAKLLPKASDLQKKIGTTIFTKPVIKVSLMLQKNSCA